MDSFWGNIFANKNPEGREAILSILRKIPVFADLKPRELKEFERVLHRREFEKGEVIFREGEPGVGMYIIYKGSVGIFKNTPSGGEELLAELKPGEFFGEMALLDESPRSATAKALEDSIILGLFQPDLFDLIERKPKLGTKILLNLAHIIGERLRRTNAELQQLREKLVESNIVY
ncbi:MAG TPA: cyclic nucleotide-binding domain-containing protein [Bacteroidetes bacterium]|nr:cyclic nucleotide-binding domain-containing protein [Bacteroidota bacterium]